MILNFEAKEMRFFMALESFSVYLSFVKIFFKWNLLADMIKSVTMIVKRSQYANNDTTDE
jgi:hypothetical protein